jgi:hypothetical protein
MFSRGLKAHLTYAEHPPSKKRHASNSNPDDDSDRDLAGTNFSQTCTVLVEVLPVLVTCSARLGIYVLEGCGVDEPLAVGDIV